MREVVPVLWDDLDLAEESRRTPAEVTRVIALGGKVRELDLTSEHARELDELLERYLRAGSVPENYRQHASPLKGRRIDPGVLDYKAGMRKFARDNNLRLTLTASGSLYYPVATQRAYDTFLAGGDWRATYQRNQRRLYGKAAQLHADYEARQLAKQQEEGTPDV